MDGFAREVERALDHFSQPDWLGEQSPLAAPYFLGHMLDDLPAQTLTTPKQRGLALQRSLQQASLQLDADQRDLLQLTFLKPDAALDKIGIAQKLHLSERSYYRYRGQAIQALAGAVNKLLVPALKSESPTHNRETMIGREQLLQEGLNTLNAGGSVALTGPSGLGKTTLGAALAHAYGNGVATCWITVRPGLNDHLGSFVFALACFLRTNCISALWRQLVADKGALNLDRALGLLRHDFAQPPLHERPALLCVDEADLLHEDLTHHAQIIHLLEALVGQVGLLLMGQRPLMAVQQHVVLTGLNEPQMQEWLQRNGLGQVSEATQGAIYKTTRGNPAMLKLLAGLHHTGGNLDTALYSLADAPAMDALFNRIWRYLGEAERDLLMQLSVFRAASPLDAWADQPDALALLRQRELVQEDDSGGIAPVPHIHRFAYARIPAEAKAPLHLKAAQVYEQRGEYASAVHHYVQGREPRMAVWLSLAHHAAELERGHAANLCESLQAISLNDLDHVEDRDALRAERGALLQFLGRSDEATEDLRRLSTSASSGLRSRSQQYLGAALEEQGQIDRAVEHYRNSLNTLLVNPDYQKVHLHVMLSHIHKQRLNDLKTARREALSAQLEATIFASSVEEEAGNLAQAWAGYCVARELAEGTEGNLLEKSRLYTYMGGLAWKRGEIGTAVALLEKAIACHQARGDVIGEARSRVNLSAAHIVAGQHQQALQETQLGFAIAEPLQNSGLLASLAGNASEACYYLGRFDEAEHFAMRSLNQEEAGPRPYALTVLGLVRHAQSDFAQASRFLKEAIVSAQTIEDKYAEAAAWRALGNVYKDEPNPTAARESYASALKLYEVMGLEKEMGELRATQKALS